MKEISDLSSNVRFCQAPSQRYMEALEDLNEDPRSVAGKLAINMAGSKAERGYQPSWESRDASWVLKKDNI